MIVGNGRGIRGLGPVGRIPSCVHEGNHLDSTGRTVTGQLALQ
jgi:hypothetical protein